MKGCASFRVGGGPPPPNHAIPHRGAQFRLCSLCRPGDTKHFWLNPHRARTDAEPHKMAAYHHTVYALLDAAFFLYCVPPGKRR